MSHLPLTTSYWPADFSSPVLGTTVGGVLRAAAAHAPDQVALVSGDPDPARRRQWRYCELLADAVRAAHALCARFAPGDPVAVWAGNCPEWVLLEFAAALAGLTLVTVNPAYQAEELAYVLGHSRARGLFLADEHRGVSLPAILAAVRGQLPDLREVVPLGEWDRFCASGDGGPLPEVDTASAAQVLYTSGTTGRPKGAVLTHRGLTNNARLAAATIGMRAGETIVHPMPLFHVAGCGLLTLGLVQTLGTHVLMPHFHPGLAFELTEAFRSVTIGGVATMLTALLDHPGRAQHARLQGPGPLAVHRQLPAHSNRQDPQGRAQRAARSRRAASRCHAARHAATPDRRSVRLRSRAPDRGVHRAAATVCPGAGRIRSRRLGCRNPVRRLVRPRCCPPPVRLQCDRARRRPRRRHARPRRRLRPENHALPVADRIGGRVTRRNPRPLRDDDNGTARSRPRPAGPGSQVQRPPAIRADGLDSPDAARLLGFVAPRARISHAARAPISHCL